MLVTNITFQDYKPHENILYSMLCRNEYFISDSKEGIAVVQKKRHVKDKLFVISEQTVTLCFFVIQVLQELEMLQAAATVRMDRHEC